MDLSRLDGKRGRRTRAWASVCVGLFGDDVAGDRAVDDADEA